MNNILLDTNFLIYSIDEDSKYFHSTHKLLQNENTNFFITSKNISEFLSVITRYPNKSLSVEKALQIVEEFLNAFTLLYASENSFNHFLNLLKKYSPIGLKIHDYEIVSIALSHSIDKIATFNQKDFSEIEEIELIVPN